MSSSPPSTKSLLLILLIFSYVFLGSAKNFDDSESLSFSPADEFQVKMKSRKLIGVDHARLDYEPPGSNPAHEPKRGGGGKGGP